MSRPVDRSDAHATTLALVRSRLEPVYSALAGVAPPVSIHETLRVAYSLAQARAQRTPQGTDRRRPHMSRRCPAPVHRRQDSQGPPHGAVPDGRQGLPRPTTGRPDASPLAAGRSAARSTSPTSPRSRKAGSCATHARSTTRLQPRPSRRPRPLALQRGRPRPHSRRPGHSPRSLPTSPGSCMHRPLGAKAATTHPPSLRPPPPAQRRCPRLQSSGASATRTKLVKMVGTMPDNEVHITTGIYDVAVVEAEIHKKIADTCPMMFQHTVNDRFDGDLDAQRSVPTDWTGCPDGTTGGTAPTDGPPDCTELD